MSESTIRKPTKKAFHFPKATDSVQSGVGGAEAIAPVVDAAGKKTGAKEASARKASARKVTAKKVVAEAVTTRKVAKKNAPARTGVAEKAAAKKAVAKKAVAKKAATKKIEATRATAKKDSVKKLPVKSASNAAKPTPVKTKETPKARRVKKEKVVRDSFTMPKSDYEKIATLKAKCLAAGVSVKKSELLRAGLLMLESAEPKRLLAVVSAVEQVKTGRPTQS